MEDCEIALGRSDSVRTARASIAVMAFTDKVLDTTGFDQDRLALLKRLAVLLNVCEQPLKTRRTAIYDAILRAQDTLGALSLGDVIYAVTDAWDNKSQTEPKKMEDELLRAGIRLFSAVMGNPLGKRIPTPSELEGPDPLYLMVEATGGKCLLCYTARRRAQSSTLRPRQEVRKWNSLSTVCTYR